MPAEETPQSILTDMDPRLQRILAKTQPQDTRPRTETRLTEAVTETAVRDAKVSVIAKVTDTDAWRAIPGVSDTNDICLAPDKKGTIVTAKVSVHELENIRLSPGVLSLKASQPIRPALHKTIEEIRARKDLLPPSTAKDHGGEGVVVGILDWGCDFVHKNFRKTDNSTRLLAIWEQRTNRVFKTDEINRALNSRQPYETLGYPATGNFDPRSPEHGTHVMDIAAGNGRGSGTPGVAPNADLVFVELNPDDVYWEGPEVVSTALGDSHRLLDAIKFIFDTAGKRPCVINLSLGTNGGPHDGTSLVEQGIDGLLLEQSNRAVIIAASNSFNDGIHAGGVVPPNGYFDLQWQVHRTDRTANELEIWYDGADAFDVELITPAGRSLGRVQLGKNAEVRDRGQLQVFIANRQSDSNNGDHEIGIFLERGASAGVWTIRLHGVRVTDGKFDAWIERDDNQDVDGDGRIDYRNQSTFVPPLNNSGTLGSISCGHQTIVVGSYDAHRGGAPISSFSSAGPTRDGRQKPEIAAPGHAVIAAASGSIEGTAQMSGTSMAAPAVTGVVALMLAEANANGLALSSDQIRSIVMKAARRNPPDGTAWNDRYGMGRIDAHVAVQEVARTVPVPSP